LIMNPLAVQALKRRYPSVWEDFDELIRCGAGWYSILDYFSYWLIHSPTVTGEPQGVVQVKEKFGELRIYVSHWEPHHAALSTLCRQISRHVCEICGEPGEWRVGLSGVPHTRCDAHVDRPVRGDEVMAPELRVLILGEEGTVAYSGQAHVTQRPYPRLSPVTFPASADAALRNRTVLKHEVANLVDTGALSDQQLALLCIAIAALDLGYRDAELGARLWTARRHSSTPAGVRRSIGAIMACWADQS
jgi:hypothetical protein